MCHLYSMLGIQSSKTNPRAKQSMELGSSITIITCQDVLLGGRFQGARGFMEVTTCVTNFIC